MEDLKPKSKDSADPSCVHLTELVVGTAKKFRKALGEQFEALGLTFAQAQLLRIIASSSAPLRMVDIAGKLDIVPRSATSQVDSLVVLGLVERIADSSDRRSITVAVTSKGQKVLEQLSEVHIAAGESLFAGLSEADRKELCRILEMVRPPSNVGRACSGVATGAKRTISGGFR